MSTDVEPGKAPEVEPAVEPEPTAQVVATFEEGVAEQLAAEKSLWHAMMTASFFAVPVCIVIWLGIVAIAVGGNNGVSWGVWLAIGAIVGVLAGVFFGGLYTFVTKSEILDEADRHSAAAKHEHIAGH